MAQVAAVVWVLSLAQELPHVAEVRKKKKKKKKRMEVSCNLNFFLKRPKTYTLNRMRRDMG